MAMNILILSCGTRVKLVQYFLQRENGFDKVVVTDCSNYAPALYVADKYYIVPKMTEPDYLNSLLEICEKEHIKVVLPLQEDEVLLMAKERNVFEKKGCLVAISGYEQLMLCKDKYKMYKFLHKNGIPTFYTEIAENCIETLQEREDIFVKPRWGAGSIGTMRVKSKCMLEALIAESQEELIVQPYIRGTEYGVDAYVDFVSAEIKALFCKKKIRMRAGETEKSISVKCLAIERLIENFIGTLDLRGALDIDVMEVQGEYYILEVNPRFGGGYPHAYECGVNFPKLLSVNANGRINQIEYRKYPQNIIGLKYTDIIVV